MLADEWRVDGWVGVRGTPCVYIHFDRGEARGNISGMSILRTPDAIGTHVGVWCDALIAFHMISPL
jgi:hypothetical protein